ncbi:MAG: hypothetical protein AB7F86_03520 [Bdellovibrionales bacterium]
MIFSSSTWAQVYRGPISSAIGGGGRAGLQSTESALLNPALIPLVTEPEFMGYFKDGQAGVGRHEHAYGVGALDNSKDVFFPGAFHYMRTRETGLASGPASGELWHMGIGKNFSEHLALGLSGYYLKHRVSGDQDYKQINASLGVLVLVNEFFGVGYVLDNLAGPASRTPRGLRQDTQQGLGFYGAISHMARLRVDLTRQERFNPDHKMAYTLGFESLMHDFFLLRMGYRRDELADEKIWTAGLGFDGPRLKIDYTFEKNEEHVSGAVHSVDMRVPF